MRDAGRIKERIELRFDGRQLAFVVLGAGVVLAIVFYLGVSVGRGLASEPVQVANALEHLDDQAARAGDEVLTFPEALTEPVARPEPAMREPLAVAKEQDTNHEAPGADEKKRAPAELAERAAADEVEAAPVARAAPTPAKLPDAGALLDAAQAKSDPASAGTFTVQAGASPNRSEAEALAGRLRDKGFSPYVVEAEIPDKGTFYRVRLGRFPSRAEADRYLSDFKRETSLPGFVTAVGK